MCGRVHAEFSIAHKDTADYTGESQPDSPFASMIGGGVKVGVDAASNPIMRYPTLAPALIVVGSMMLKVLKEIEWDKTLRSTFPPS